MREDAHEGEAKRFLDAALELPDPVTALFDAVDSLMASELHRMAVQQEREMGSWDKPSDKPKPATHKVQYRKPAKPRATQKQRRQLSELRWVPGKGKIPWREITVPDMRAAIEHCKRSISGINTTIEFWESAIRMCHNNGVSKLGDVPGFQPEDWPEETA